MTPSTPPAALDKALARASRPWMRGSTQLAFTRILCGFRRAQEHTAQDFLYEAMRQRGFRWTAGRST